MPDEWLGWLSDGAGLLSGFDNFIADIQYGAASPPCPAFDKCGGFGWSVGKDNRQAAALDGMKRIDDGLRAGIAPVSV